MGVLLIAAGLWAHSAVHAKRLPLVLHPARAGVRLVAATVRSSCMHAIYRLRVVGSGMCVFSSWQHSSCGCQQLHRFLHIAAGAGSINCAPVPLALWGHLVRACFDGGADAF
jgi:hypothetical protein